MYNNQLFVEYYKEWVSIYKEGAIRPITLSMLGTGENRQKVSSENRHF